MKSVLISIQPKWVEKIASGQKTVEVRKNKPNLATLFKCYIYMSQGTYKDLGTYSDWIYENRMKVIGEFVCDRVLNIPFTKPFLYYGKKMFHSNNCCKEACLSYIELENYLGDKDGYGLHISDLKIYDKPKELSEFKKPCDRFLDCITCKRLVRNDFLSCDNIITRPPQSWCYVETGE